MYLTQVAQRKTECQSQVVQLSLCVFFPPTLPCFFGQFLGKPLSTSFPRPRSSSSEMLRIHRLLFLAFLGLVVGEELKKLGKANDRERRSYLLSGRLFAGSPSIGGNFFLPRNLLPSDLATDSEKKRRCRRGAKKEDCQQSVPLCSKKFDISADREKQLILKPITSLEVGASLIVLLRKFRYPRKPKVLLDSEVEIRRSDLRFEFEWEKGTIGRSGQAKLMVSIRPRKEEHFPQEDPVLLCTTYLRRFSVGSDLYAPKTLLMQYLMRPWPVRFGRR